MALIEGVVLKNFKCYRNELKFSLSKSNFFIGANNAGKSAVLKAVQCFFDDNSFDPSFINQTEFRAKGVGYNKSSIGVEFNVDDIPTKTLRGNLRKNFGSTLIVTKVFTFREVSETVLVEYIVNDQNYSDEDLPSELHKLLSKITVSYIHPQEANDLLSKAQEKLKRRLLSNWGRTAQLADALKDLQEQWDNLRQRANSYLSSGLTQSLQQIWPGCETKVDLPDSIEEVIGISEILFRSGREYPDISLTSQGTGAQSTILYQTHYLLDSDKTLHRGFYHPIWLIEEPESFLHADIIFKLGYLLCSSEWLNNIQMLISTHSPLLLATSRSNASEINWVSLDKHNLVKEGVVKDWSEEEVSEVGILMGDPNFDVYFKTSDNSKIIIIEDTKDVTKEKLIEAGIAVTHQIKGGSQQRRYFDVLRAVDISMGRNIFFLIDNDEGVSNFKNVIESGELVAQSDEGFKKYRYNHNVFLILFPSGYAMEELFEEHEGHLESCVYQIFNEDFTQAATKENIPPQLSRAHAYIRNKSNSDGLEGAKKIIRNNQDVKESFWKKVAEDDLKITELIAQELSQLLE